MRVLSLAWIVLGVFMMIAQPIFSEPLVIAHRGFSSVAPENTLAAMKKAIAMNPQPAFVELDIHRSLDGVLVVCHDSSTRRTGGVDWVIREKPFAEIRSLSAGYKEKFADMFASEKFPRLEEVLDLVKNTPVGVMIECKQLFLEDQLIRLLKERGELQKHVVASFDAITVFRAKEIEPSVKTLFLKDTLDSGVIWDARILRRI